MRSTPGNSFGPMAISATTAMTTNSLQPMSNIKDSAYARQFPPNMHEQYPGAISGSPASFPNRSCRTSVAGSTRRRRFAETCAGSDSLAADIRPRRRRRRSVMIDRLYGLGLFRSLFIVLHALLEGLDALRDVTHQVGNLAATKQQQDDCDHHDPVPNAKRTHPATLQNAR